MADLSRSLVEFVTGRLTNTNGGFNSTLAHLRSGDQTAPGDVRLFLKQNVPAETLEKANSAMYPSIAVYCEKLSNTMREKFRVFSGTARLVIELRVSHDRLHGLQEIAVYTEVLRSILTDLRGEWFPGINYGGGYDIANTAVKAGGKNFVQTMKITFDVDVSE